MRIEHHRIDPLSPNTERWYWGKRWNRFGVSVNVYRHRSTHGPDRWVVNPSIVYDRKRRE